MSRVDGRRKRWRLVLASPRTLTAAARRSDCSGGLDRGLYGFLLRKTCLSRATLKPAVIDVIDCRYSRINAQNRTSSPPAFITVDSCAIELRFRRRHEGENFALLVCARVSVAYCGRAATWRNCRHHR